MTPLSEFETYLRFVLALAVVLGLALVAGWVMRRFGLGGTIGGAGGRPRRLGIVEALPLDARRRLVLVRRDAVEHLLLIGPAADVVIERTITPPPASPEPAADAKKDTP